MEPEMVLSEEERRAKEKRMIEIKKMIALQSLQQFNDDHQSNGSTHQTSQLANSNYNNNNNNSYMANTSYQNHEQGDFHKEKKARERVRNEMLLIFSISYYKKT